MMNYCLVTLGMLPNISDDSFQHHQKYEIQGEIQHNLMPYTGTYRADIPNPQEEVPLLCSQFADRPRKNMPVCCILHGSELYWHPATITLSHSAFMIYDRRTGHPEDCRSSQQQRLSLQKVHCRAVFRSLNYSCEYIYQ